VHYKLEGAFLIRSSQQDVSGNVLSQIKILGQFFFIQGFRLEAHPGLDTHWGRIVQPHLAPGKEARARKLHEDAAPAADKAGLPDWRSLGVLVYAGAARYLIGGSADRPSSASLLWIVEVAVIVADEAVVP